MMMIESYKMPIINFILQHLNIIWKIVIMICTLLSKKFAVKLLSVLLNKRSNTFIKSIYELSQKKMWLKTMVFSVYYML
jgi:hypothetical protein